MRGHVVHDAAIQCTHPKRPLVAISLQVGVHAIDNMEPSGGSLPPEEAACHTEFTRWPSDPSMTDNDPTPTEAQSLVTDRLRDWGWSDDRNDELI